MPRKKQSSPPPKSLSEQVLELADQLDQETDQQIKATSRILGAAAQMANHHDQLIQEVVEMIEGDLDERNQALLSTSTTKNSGYSEDSLRRQHKTLQAARTHFGLRANSWQRLVAQLNNHSQTPNRIPNQTSSDLMSRLQEIDHKIDRLHHEIKDMAEILMQISNHFQTIRSNPQG